MKQTIGNACGTIGVLHALANNTSTVSIGEPCTCISSKQYETSDSMRHPQVSMDVACKNVPSIVHLRLQSWMFIWIIPAPYRGCCVGCMPLLAAGCSLSPEGPKQPVFPLHAPGNGSPLPHSSQQLLLWTQHSAAPSWRIMCIQSCFYSVISQKGTHLVGMVQAMGLSCNAPLHLLLT